MASKLFLLSMFCLTSLYSPKSYAESDVGPTILALGDSLTFGYEVAKEDSWPVMVEKKLHDSGYPNAKIINAGSSGATSAFGLPTLRFHLKKSKPNWVVIALGANDGLRGINPEETEKNLAETIEFAKKNKINVLLLGMKAPPNYGNKFPDAFEKVFQTLSGRYEIEFIPFFLEGVAGEAKYNQADGIHPNPKGYEIISDRIFKKLREIL